MAPDSVFKGSLGTVCMHLEKMQAPATMQPDWKLKGKTHAHFFWNFYNDLAHHWRISDHDTAWHRLLFLGRRQVRLADAMKDKITNSPTEKEKKELSNRLQLFNNAFEYLPTLIFLNMQQEAAAVAGNLARVVCELDEVSRHDHGITQWNLVTRPVDEVMALMPFVNQAFRSLGTNVPPLKRVQPFIDLIEQVSYTDEAEKLNMWVLMNLWEKICILKDDREKGFPAMIKNSLSAGNHTAEVIKQQQDRMAACVDHISFLLVDYNWSIAHAALKHFWELFTQVKDDKTPAFPKLSQEILTLPRQRDCEDETKHHIWLRLALKRSRTIQDVPQSVKTVFARFNWGPVPWRPGPRAYLSTWDPSKGENFAAAMDSIAAADLPTASLPAAGPGGLPKSPPLEDDDSRSRHIVAGILQDLKGKSPKRARIGDVASQQAQFLFCRDCMSRAEHRVFGD